MAIRLSDAACALMAGDVGLRRSLAGAHITFYEGQQPDSANDNIGTSQSIISFTLNDSVWTGETRAQWKFTLTNTTLGDTCTSVKIGGAAGTNGFDILGGTVTATASDDTTMAAQITAAINANIANCDFTATASSGAVTITAPYGTGVALNTAIVVAAGSGITFTYNDGGGTGAVFTTGVASANGFTFSAPADGSGLAPAEDVFYIQKSVGETWKGKNGFGPAGSVATAVFAGIISGNSYTANWGRLCATAGDDGSAATSGESGYVRVDFSVGTTSAYDVVMQPTNEFVVNTASGYEIESALTSFRLKIDKNMA